MTIDPKDFRVRPGHPIDLHKWPTRVRAVHQSKSQYHSILKSHIQEQWERADGRVIVASNAFGLGIDRPDVRVVIHVGPIYQMRNYSQESGRGGRDRQRSKAIVVMPAGKQEALQKKQDQARVRKQPWKI